MMQIKQLSTNIYSVYGLPRWLSGKESTCQAGDMGLISGLGRSPGWEDPLEKEIVTHSSIHACGISWTEAITHGVAESDMTEQLNNNLQSTIPWL